LSRRVDDRFYPRLFGVAALGLLGWVLFRILTPFLTPILWSILLAFLLQPLNAGLKRRLRGRAGLAAGLLTVGATLCVILPAASLGVAFPGQVSRLLARVSGEAKRLQLGQPSDVFRLAPVATALDWLQTHFSVTAADIQQWVLARSTQILKLMAAKGGTLVLGALGFLLHLVLTLFLLFFFLRDGAAMIERLDRAVPLPDERKERLRKQLASVTKAVVLGSLVTSLVQGALVAIGFAVVGLPSPIVFGAIAAALSLLPVGGTALVWAPGAIALAAQDRWPWAIGLALYGILIVGTVDNFLKPRLVSGRAEIGTLPVFLGVLGGLAAFGAIGAILGPVVIALALALLTWAEEDLRRQPARES
jgi:predicted PurR-regulated permease PerM